MKEIYIKLLAVSLFITTFPIWILIYLIFKLTCSGTFIFKQKRVGKDGRVFYIYKIRTMLVDAEKNKSKVINLNEVDGPVFKIRNDPRYTKFGRFLSHTGLDELPQLFNVIKGEMDFVGPRPLPVEEVKLIPKKYSTRLSILPGITSPWILQGAHKLTFEEWMNLDLLYLKNKSLWYDSVILGKSLLLIVNFIYKKILIKDEKA